MKPRILHLTADYPDRFDTAKTGAIRGLIEGTRDSFDHLVISLNRQGGPLALVAAGQIRAVCAEPGLLALQYRAPPAIMAIARPMHRLAEQLVRELDGIGFRPDLIQGHKLSVEGWLARCLASRLGVPYALTLQGNTDQKLIAARPDRLPALRAVWHDARAIMGFAPWTVAWCAARLQQPAHQPSVIPCPIQQDIVIPPVPTPALVRTAFNLDFWRNKNILTLLTAVGSLVAQGRDLRLEIAGAGSAAARRAVRSLVARAGMADRAVMVGPVQPEQIQRWFNGAALFALPSRRESFGMVFAEALLAGTPVIYPAGAAIDGYFPGATFARPVKANDPVQLAEQIDAMLTDNAAIKADLARLQASGGLARFQRDRVLADYSRFLRGALS